jgi:hypothetical protein
LLRCCHRHNAYKSVKINSSIKQIANPESPIFSSNVLTYFKNQRTMSDKVKDAQIGEIYRQILLEAAKVNT